MGGVINVGDQGSGCSIVHTSVTGGVIHTEDQGSGCTIMRTSVMGGVIHIGALGPVCTRIGLLCVTCAAGRMVLLSLSLSLRGGGG